MNERRRVDPTATARLQANVVDLVAILLRARGFDVERFDDGRRRLPSLEIRAELGAAVVLHVDPVIA